MANTPMTEQNEERQQLHSGAKHVNCAYNIKWADKKLNIPFNAHKLIINAYKADNHITHLISILLKINNYYEILLTLYTIFMLFYNLKKTCVEIINLGTRPSQCFRSSAWQPSKWHDITELQIFIEIPEIETQVFT